MIQIHFAKGCKPTAEVLRLLVEKEQAGESKKVPEVGHVYWGFPGAASPALNSKASAFNKLQELEVLAKAGVVTVPFMATKPFAYNAYPVLARKLKHHGGLDIILCKGPVGVRKALARGRSFFTQFIPSRTEYRVWVYRGRHLGTYEKVLAHPEKRHRVGRNHRNGYAFQLVTEANIPRAAVTQAVQSIQALGLDFGAVDILQGNDGRYFVLEVNSAPGVEGEGRQVIQSLAHRIVRWEQAGFPGRKEDVKQS